MGGNHNFQKQMINLDGITKRYGKKEILNDLHLEVAEGEHVVLTGPSGCGKSTLLRIIAGLEDVSTGMVTLRNQKVTDGEKILVTPQKRNLALIPQDLGLWPSSSVKANILLGRRGGGKLDALANKLGITELLKKKVSVLSAGERQRVALARFLLDPPDILLLDEPFSALDVIRRQEMYQLMRSLKDELQATMLTVTHEPGDAIGLGANRVVVIEDGIIVDDWKVRKGRKINFKSKTLQAWGIYDKTLSEY